MLKGRLRGTLCVVEHVLSILLVKFGTSRCHCVTATFVGMFYKLFLSSLKGLILLAWKPVFISLDKIWTLMGTHPRREGGDQFEYKKKSVDFLLPESSLCVCPLTGH